MKKSLIGAIALGVIASSGVANAGFFFGLSDNSSSWFGSMGGDLAHIGGSLHGDDSGSGWFGGLDSVDGGHITAPLHRPVSRPVVTNAGYGNVEIKTSKDAFSKLAGGQGIYRGGEMRPSTVTLAVATPKKNPPSFGGGFGGDEDSRDYNADGSYAGLGMGGYEEGGNAEASAMGSLGFD